MSRALLIVDHGSSLPEAHAHLEAIAEAVRRRAPQLRVAVAHMDGVPPSIEEGLEILLEQGARRVAIHPLFLVPGRHLSSDIPDLVTRASSRHPELEIEILEPLGNRPEIADLIVASLDGR